MSTDNIQGILSRLYTDTLFRNLFLQDKALFYEQNNISSATTMAYLDAIPVKQLLFFSAGLSSKRWHEVKNLLPLSSLLLKKEAITFFTHYSETYLPKGIHKHHDDAIQFITYLQQQVLSIDIPLNFFIKSVLAYEYSRIQNFMNPKKIRIAFYQYDHVAHYTRLLKEDTIVLPKKKITVVLWKRNSLLKVF
jgi:hypothetical protein